MRSPIRVVQAVLALLALAAPFAVTDYYSQGILVMMMWYAYMTVAWNFVTFTGHFFMAHVALAGIGAYASTIMFLQLGVSPWIGMLVGGVVSVVAGLLIGIPTFRLRGPYFLLTTIAFSEIIRLWVENTEIGPFGMRFDGAQGLSVPPLGNNPAMFQFSDKVPYYYIILLMLAISVGISIWIVRSRLGFYLSAIRSDQDAAESLAINSAKYKLQALAISAFLLAMGGSFYAQYIHFVSPGRNLGMGLAIEILVMGVVGGQATVWGPVLGALLLTPVSEVIRATLGGSYAGLHGMLYGLVMVAVILLMPKGIYPALLAWWRRMEPRFGRNPRSTTEALLGSDGSEHMGGGS